MTERWLVIAHEATNSGAPRMLLKVLRGVRAARGPGWTCDILLRQGGILADDFARLGRVHLLPHRCSDGETGFARFWRKFVDRPWVRRRRLRRMIDQWRDSQFDLIYNNTATNGYLVPAARTLGCPVLTHVHETAYALRGFNTPVSLNQTLENSDHFLAVSPSVAADLIDCGVQGDRITVIPNFLPVLPSEPDENARQILRAQLNLPPGRPLIVGCGHIHWVKGTDLFVEVASVLAGSTQPKPFFVWLGGETDFEFSQQVRQLVCSRQLVDMVRFVGPVPDAQPWLAASDAVVVTSRVESFSLVALEAAALGRPVAGFADARGLASLLEDEPSQLVAKFDPVAMASVLNEMIRHPSRARQLGLRLRAKVADCFLAGPRVAAILSIVDKLKQDRKNLNKGSH